MWGGGISTFLWSIGSSGQVDMNPGKTETEEPVLADNADYNSAHYLGGQLLCVTGSVMIC